jgi:PAP2 superfamily
MQGRNYQLSRGLLLRLELQRNPRVRNNGCAQERKHHEDRWMGWAYIAAIAVSCITTGQHYIADVLLSMVIAPVFMYLFSCPMPALTPSETRSSKAKLPSGPDATALICDPFLSIRLTSATATFAPVTPCTALEMRTDDSAAGRLLLTL